MFISKVKNDTNIFKSLSLAVWFSSWGTPWPDEWKTYILPFIARLFYQSSKKKLYFSSFILVPTLLDFCRLLWENWSWNWPIFMVKLLKNHCISMGNFRNNEKAYSRLLKRLRDFFYFDEKKLFVISVERNSFYSSFQAICLPASTY